MIVLLILKWIGIVLLCILAFLLVLLLLILFSPVRYDVNADIDPPGTPADQGDPEGSTKGDGKEKAEEKPLAERARARVRVRYLFSALRGRFDWPTLEDGEPFTVSLLFFRLFPRKKKEKPVRKKRSRRGGDAGTESGTNTAGTGEDAVKTDEGKIGTEPVETDSAGSGVREPDTTQDEDTESAEPEEDIDTSAYEARPDGEGSPETGGSTGKRRKKKQPSGKPFQPQIVIKKIYYTISGTCAKIGMVRATIESSVYFRAKRVLLNELRRVMKQILPRGTRIILTFGAKDPKTTGDVMAAVGMLYPVFTDSVQVTPVFDDETIYGSARIKGKIIPAVLAFSFLRCYFNRDIRRIVKRVKKIREVNHGREQG